MPLMPSYAKTANVRLKCGKRRRINALNSSLNFYIFSDSFIPRSLGALALEGGLEP